MPSWTSSTWLNAPPLFAAGVGDPPVLSLTSPVNGAINVPVTAPIRVAIFSTEGIDTVTLTVNEVIAFNGSTFMNGYCGFFKDFAGRRFIELTPCEGYDEGTVYRVHIEVLSDIGGPAEADWSFTSVMPTTYAGNELLPLEAALLTPLTRFLELEPVRLLLLQQAVVDDMQSTPNRNNVAARVLYQAAYSTEISAALNPFHALNTAALTSPIAARRSTLALSTSVEAYKNRIEAGLTQLFSSGAFPADFRNNFADYLESLLYSYRVSAAATLVFLACAIEQADNG